MAHTCPKDPLPQVYLAPRYRYPCDLAASFLYQGFLRLGQVSVVAAAPQPPSSVHSQIGLPAVLTGGKQQAWAGSVGLPPLAKSKNEINLREEPRGVGVHLFSTPYWWRYWLGGGHRGPLAPRCRRSWVGIWGLRLFCRQKEDLWEKLQRRCGA